MNMKMNIIICLTLLFQTNSVPLLKCIRVKYKLAKKKGFKLLKPLNSISISDETIYNSYNSSYINKNIRVNYKIAKKGTNRLLLNKYNIIVKNQNKILDKSFSLISDNIVNEVLYLLKFYHITNDNINSYMYILAYELCWFGYKVIRINTIDKSEITKEETKILYRQLVLNIIMYMLIKNIFVNTIVKALNKD